jgi:hypothetical protein
VAFYGAEQLNLLTGRAVSPLMEKSSTLLFSDASVAECPDCTAAIPFRRSLDPVIDRYGFETYVLVCPACGHSFSGVIDPGDDAFLAHDVR